MKKKKRLPFSRQGICKRPNLPNTQDMKGSRLYVVGGVNEIKRILKAEGVAYKKVRTAEPGIVEIIYTQISRKSPFSVLYKTHRIVR